MLWWNVLDMKFLIISWCLPKIWVFVVIEEALKFGFRLSSSPNPQIVSRCGKQVCKKNFNWYSIIGPNQGFMFRSWTSNVLIKLFILWNADNISPCILLSCLLLVNLCQHRRNIWFTKSKTIKTTANFGSSKETLGSNWLHGHISWFLDVYLDKFLCYREST